MGVQSPISGYHRIRRSIWNTEVAVKYAAIVAIQSVAVGRGGTYIASEAGRPSLQYEQVMLLSQITLAARIVAEVVFILAYDVQRNQEKFA